MILQINRKEEKRKQKSVMSHGAKQSNRKRGRRISARNQMITHTEVNTNKRKGEG
jgi:hypothetical protein